MKGQSFLDAFCHNLKLKYGNCAKLTVETVGVEYTRVLLGEALAGERFLGEKFVGVYFPYPELQGFHHECDSEQLTIGFDRSDTTWEQLRTKLHELGEYVLSRLSLVWPEYGRILRYLKEVEGDGLADRFANGVLAELMPKHTDVTQRMLLMRLALILTNVWLTTSLQMSESIAPGSSAYASREIVEMLARMDSMLVGFYQHLTDHILLQERENSLSSEQMQVKSCPVCQAIFNGQRRYKTRGNGL